MANNKREQNVAVLVVSFLGNPHSPTGFCLHGAFRSPDRCAYHLRTTVIIILSHASSDQLIVAGRIMA